MMSTGGKTSHVPVIWHSEGGDSSIGKLSNNTSSIDHGVTQEPLERSWSPYDFNGGSGLAIAGDDYVVIAGDTRMSTGYNILTRCQSKLHSLTSKCIIASAGCRADVDTLWKVLDGDVVMYKYNIGRDIITTSVSQMLSNTLYSRRFFPYYAFTTLAGLDEEGKGVVYAYDAIGSYQSVPYSAIGSGEKYLIPIMDNLVEFKTRNDPKPNRTASETVELIKDAFVSVAECDIYTGDTLEIMVISADGVKVETFQLKKD
eukprot:507538_1